MADHLLAPLTVADPDGVPTTISSIDTDTTAGELAAAIGLTALTVEGRPVAGDAPILTIDELRIGARLGAGHERSPAPDAAPHAVPWAGASAAAGSVGTGRTGEPLVDVAVVAGPACAPWQSLPAGRHVIGRAPLAAVRLADPAVELHHGLLDVAADGTVRFTQLAGAVPARVDGSPVEANQQLDTGRRLRLGASILVVRPSTPNPDAGRDDVPSATPATAAAPVRSSSGLVPHPVDPWRRVVQRTRRPEFGRDGETLQAPVPADEPRMPPTGGLVGAAVAVAGALVIAAVVGSALFVIFAAVGAFAAGATWAVNAIGVWRMRRRCRREHAVATAAFLGRLKTLADLCARRLHLEHGDVLEAIGVVDDDPNALWSRRLRSPSGEDDDGSPFTATIGCGTVRWSPPIERAGDLDHALASALERASRLCEVPIVMTIASGESVAIDGSPTSTMALARSLVVQLAVHSGPADWQLVVATDDPDRWRWVDWLPHGAVRSRHAAVLDPARLADELDEIDHDRRTLVVVDDPDLLLTRTGPLRRFLTRPGVSGLVVTGGQPVPAMCRRVHHIGETGRGSWVGPPRVTGDTGATGAGVVTDAGVEIDTAGLSIEVADRVARRLAGLVDPEDRSGGVTMPTAVSLTQLFGDVVVRPEAIARRWEAGCEDPSPATVLGRSADGVVDVDLVRDGPHGLIAGTTGAGKSELLRSLVVGLAVSVSPAHLNFVLVDYKGGSTFDACVRLPHTVGVVTDLDDGLAERALASLTAELHRRESLLRAVGAPDLTAYRRGGHRPGIARLVVVIDEFAALAAELPGFLSALVGIAQRGRSLGVHLLLATQRPAGVVSDEIRANTNLRLALRLNDRGDAVDVVGDATPTTFGRSVPGRAVMRLGPDELVVFQSAWCTGPIVSSTGGLTVERRWQIGASTVGRAEPSGTGPSELEVAVDSVVQAAFDLDLPAPHRPWIDPLPHPLPAELLGESPGPGVIGLVDQPERQQRAPLRWRPSDGSLALIGSLGSGTTSTLIALAAATCRDRRPDDVHLYVIDARGDDVVQALAALAHCGGVVRLTEGERLHRLVARLVAEIDQRCDGSAASDRDVVLMIDGWSSLRAALSTVERADTFELLRRVVHDGPAVGVVTIVTDSGDTSLAAVPVADRWVFHLADPTVARGLGVARATVGSGRPGGLVIASSGHVAQVAAGAPGLASIAGRDAATTSGPDIIACLPAIVTALRDPVADTGSKPASNSGSKPASNSASSRGSGERRLLLGLDAEHLEPDGLLVTPGDAVLIVGQPRTGVSTALDRCVAAWRSSKPADASQPTARRDRVVVRVDRHRPLTPEQLDVDAELLVVVDDAHRVGDPNGLIASIVAGDHRYVTVLAGARADAVRSGYGHWTRAVAAARCGLVMTSRGDPDGDVFGVTVPRRSLIPARPGLAWVVDGGPLRQIQLACFPS